MEIKGKYICVCVCAVFVRDCVCIFLTLYIFKLFQVLLLLIMITPRPMEEAVAIRSCPRLAVPWVNIRDIRPETPRP
jgi:hypothetical protein